MDTTPRNSSDAPGGTPSRGRDGGRGRAGGSLAPDRVAGHQRQRACPARDARARARGDAQARLPAEHGRAGAGHRPVAHTRRRDLRHDAVRPGVDAGRHRAGRARGGLLRLDRQSARRSTARGAAGDRAPARPGRRRDPRDRPAGGRGRRRCGTCRRTCRSSRSRRARRTASRSSPSTSTAGAASATSTCSTSATGPSATSPARGLARGPAAHRGLARRSRPARRASRRRCAATGARGRATSSAGGWPRTRT